MDKFLKASQLAGAVASTYGYVAGWVIGKTVAGFLDAIDTE